MSDSLAGENPAWVSASHMPSIEHLQAAYKKLVRSRRLKRMERGSEDELTVGGPAAMNGCSPEILFLWDPSQVLYMSEGNTVWSVIGEFQAESWGRRPLRATHFVN